ncbi:eukaryotic translation initiation factor 2-alpha kinase 1-like isoform X2 [Argonauta hians]
MDLHAKNSVMQLMNIQNDMNGIPMTDHRDLFRREDIKKINKFDGMDAPNKVVPYDKDSSTKVILASLLDFFCSFRENDRKKSSKRFKGIIQFLSRHNIIDASLAQDEFQGVRSDIAKIFSRLFLVHNQSITSSMSTQDVTTYDRYDKEFEDLGPLGQGGFGSVRKAFNKLDKLSYAVKKIQVKNMGNASRIKQILDEVKTLASLKHKHIVGYNSAWLECSIFNTVEYPEELDEESSNSTPNSLVQAISIKEISASVSDSFESPNKICTPSTNPKSVQILYIQMELCEGTLLQWLESRNNDINPYIDTETNRKILQETIEGLDYIHSKGIVHRDIKPANIFLQHDFSVKIGDFGLARTYLPDSNVAEEDFSPLSVGVGTSTYSSPEQLNSSNYNTKCDIYSFGLILYEMYYVFSTRSELSHMFQKLKETGEVNELVTKEFPDKAELIKEMTKKDPKERVSAHDILNQILLPDKDKIINQQKKEIQYLKNKLEEYEKLLLKSQEKECRCRKES